MKRVLIAHSIKHTPEEVEAACRILGEQMRAVEPDVEVVAGRTYFDQRFSIEGSWDAWSASVARRDPRTGRPRFEGLVVIVGRYGVGNATKGMIAACRKAGVPVWTWSEVTGEWARQ